MQDTLPAFHRTPESRTHTSEARLQRRVKTHSSSMGGQRYLPIHVIAWGSLYFSGRAALQGWEVASHREPFA